MKLIIDINENVYTRLFDNGRPMDIADGIVMERAIRNGTPIPDNATNGDVIKAMFPDCLQEEDEVYFATNLDIETVFRKNWWNAPYQKGGKE